MHLDKLGVANVLHDKGVLLNSIGQMNEARENFDNALKIYENEKTIILDSVNTEVISAAMEAVKNKINTKENIKNTFDYRQYKSEAVTWLNCVINGEN